MIELTGAGKMYSVSGRGEPGIFNSLIGRNKSSSLWAVKDVNLNIKVGEFVGIIGENGSGKTTLLRIIAGITKPTTGSIKVKGEVASLLELGITFQPELTVRENIYLYGVVMGLTRPEVDKRIRKIVELAGIDRFLSTKLGELSTGMCVRLAFAIAMHSDAPIILIDEALAVGDINFEKRCMDVFNRLRAERRTVVIAGHDITNIERLCDRVALLEKGRLVAIGKPKKIIKKYKIMMGNKSEKMSRKPRKYRTDIAYFNSSVKKGFYVRDYFDKYKDVTKESGYCSYPDGPHFEPHVNLIINIFNPKKALDVGCAKGFFVKRLRERGIEAYGIDISRYAVNSAHPQTRAFIKKADILKIPWPNNYFDVVSCLETMEHLHPDEIDMAIKEMKRVTTNHIFLTIPLIGGEDNHRCNIDRLTTDRKGLPLHGHWTCATRRWWIDRFKKQGMENCTDMEKRAIRNKSTEYPFNIFIFRKSDKK